ncbi:MAG: hemerythrin domain-containing protein [Candidatus Omnitrophica bacterium]|nr:hemerythrin domain-containing protein [Candidatus Omnitrophota bacterium]
MRSDITAQNNLIRIFNNKHRETLVRVECFEDALRSLKYEGKVSRGKNIANVKTLIGYFGTHLKRHMRAEERILYPFFDIHVPKYDSVIALFRLEHREINRNMRKMVQWIKLYDEWSQKGLFSEWLKSFYVEGMCFVHLTRHHLVSESATLFKSVICCLHGDEIGILEKKMKTFLIKNDD